MPELCRFYGLIIRLYYDDHSPPHFHVWRGKKYLATFAIEDVEVIDGSLTRPELALVTAWTYMHQRELSAAWGDAQENRRLKKIAPLK
jgi:hypothetical protein